MGGLPGVPEGGSGGGEELEDVGRLTGLFPGGPGVVLTTVPVLDPASFIGQRGNGLTPSKIDDFLSEPSL